MSTRRKTQEQFVKEIYQLVKDEYTVLGKYKNSRTKIKMRHNKCDFEWEVEANSFLRGSRCAYCSGRLKKTTESFTKEVKDKVGDEYVVLGEYKNSNTSIKMKHNKCGYIFMMSPSNFLNLDRRCPDCGGTRKKTHGEFVQEVHNLVGEEYDVLTTYKNNREKVKIRHNSESCGFYIYEVSPSDFSVGTRCPECAKKRVAKSHMITEDEFQRRLRERFGKNTVANELYKGIGVKISFTHLECGRTFEATPGALYICVKGCPLCTLEKRTKKLTKTQEEFEQDVLNLVGDEYKVIGKYANTETPITMRHNSQTCNYHEYNVRPGNFLAGQTCPRCFSSKGEEKVMMYLDKDDILFEQQVRFEDCRNKNPLPFDFGLFDKSDNLLLLIEYDGKQHFEPVQFGGKSIEEAEKDLEITQFHDSIKNKYCIDNSIPLLRIPYWDFDNIENILEAELHKHNLLPKQSNKVLEVV